MICTRRPPLISRRFSGSVPPLMLLSHPFLMCWFDQCCQHHRRPFVISELCAIFCHVAPLHAIIMSTYIKWRLISLRKNISPIKPNRTATSPSGSGFQYRFYCTSAFSINSIWLTGCCTICCLAFRPIVSALLQGHNLFQNEFSKQCDRPSPP